MLAGTLILTDRRPWTPLLAGAVAAMVASAALHQQPFLPGVALAVIRISEALAAAWLVRRTVGGHFTLERVSHTARLILFAIVASLAGGIIAAPVVAATTATSLLVAWQSSALADALGMLAMAPVTVAAIAGWSSIRALACSWRALEFGVMFAATILVATTILGAEPDPLFRAPAYVLPFLLWSAFRFGPGGTSATVLAVSLIGIWNAVQGQGPLASADLYVTHMALRAQGAIAVAVTSLLLLASVVAERTRVAGENAALVNQLQQALAEVKTLRGLIPICAWCHKVRDDAGFWQQIEMYLDARTDATFSHSICPSCAEEAHDELVSHNLPPRL